jgi:hypothetical protein
VEPVDPNAPTKPLPVSRTAPTEPIVEPVSRTAPTEPIEEPVEPGESEQAGGGRARWRAQQEAAGAPPAAQKKYGAAIARARENAGGEAGACEAAKESLMQDSDVSDASHKTEWVGRGPNRFQHEIVISKEGYVLDPVAKQAIVRGLTTETQLKMRGLWGAVEKGIFTPEQWARFKALGK